eukprot:TRINITY_DN33968_c0_g1_i1.p1 TRINITY_DN33968_c0_g1~~TRINITY_DN33968_c0_g1_i1.p1  ORF type:complete len:304 (-),score=60.14 TRINITY_DN33968_c0_g1_i1:720-1631(-)
MTLGISAADYGLCLGQLRKELLARLDEADRVDEADMSDDAFWDSVAPVPIGCLVPSTSDAGRGPEVAQLIESGLRLLRLLQAIEPERWRYHNLDWLQRVCEEVAEQHLDKHMALLAAQAEAYEEVTSAKDGIFYACGAADTASAYRRSMLEHQAREEERKRCSDSVGDPRFVKRIDPADGLAKTRQELSDVLLTRGLSLADVDSYWHTRCLQLYPDDRPPQDLMTELGEAGKSFRGLMNFLERRTPHLRYKAELNEENDLANKAQPRDAPASSMSPQCGYPAHSHSCARPTVWELVTDWEAVD